MAAPAPPANGAAQAAAARLLDFAQPLDVAVLDATVNAFYGAGSNEEVSVSPPRPATSVGGSRAPGRQPPAPRPARPLARGVLGQGVREGAALPA